MLHCHLLWLCVFPQESFGAKMHIRKWGCVGFMFLQSRLTFCKLNSTSFSPSLIFLPEAYTLKLSRLCKFCDVQPTACTGKGSCKVECDITAICPSNEDVCVSIW